MIAIGTALGALCLLGGVMAYSFAKSRAHQSDAVAEKTKFSLTANDGGRRFVYAVGTHFSIFLDEAHYPEAKLHCTPEGVVELTKDLGVAPEGLYTARFTVIGSGSCRLQNGDFSVLIVGQ